MNQKKQHAIDGLRASKQQFFINVRLWLSVCAEVFPKEHWEYQPPHLVMEDGIETIRYAYRGQYWLTSIVYAYFYARHIREFLMGVRDSIDDDLDKNKTT